MNTFTVLHRSIFSPQFYREARSFSRGKAFRFVVAICCITACITGASRTYYAFDETDGIPAQAAAAFFGMEIRDGRLDPHVKTPYVPEVSHLSILLNTVFCLPHLFDSLPDSFVVVDTAPQALSAMRPATQILLSANYVYVTPKSPLSFKIPYSSLIPRPGSLKITRQSVRTFCLKHLGAMFFNFSMISGVLETGVFLLSIIFLAFAAYIFRSERTSPAGPCFVMACYAAAPIYIGTNLVAISGTSFPWTWPVLIFFSTIVMSRGVRASVQTTQDKDVSEQ